MQDTVQYTIEKYVWGFIGQCVEFPQIFTEAKTKDALKKEMAMVLDGYFKAEPKAYKAIKKNVGYGAYIVKKNT